MSRNTKGIFYLKIINYSVGYFNNFRNIMLKNISFITRNISRFVILLGVTEYFAVNNELSDIAG